MSNEIIVSNTAESWINRWGDKEDRRAMLADINKIMCQIVSDQSEEVITPDAAFDMLLTLANLSTFIESLGE